MGITQGWFWIRLSKDVSKNPALKLGVFFFFFFFFFFVCSVFVFIISLAGWRISILCMSNYQDAL